MGAHTQVSSGFRQRREPLFNFQPPCEVFRGCQDSWHAGAVAAAGCTTCQPLTPVHCDTWRQPPPHAHTRRMPHKNTPESVDKEA